MSIQGLITGKGNPTTIETSIAQGSGNKLIIVCAIAGAFGSVDPVVIVDSVPAETKAYKFFSGGLQSPIVVAEIDAPTAGSHEFLLELSGAKNHMWYVFSVSGGGSVVGLQEVLSGNGGASVSRTIDTGYSLGDEFISVFNVSEGYVDGSSNLTLSPLSSSQLNNSSGSASIAGFGIAEDNQQVSAEYVAFTTPGGNVDRYSFITFKIGDPAPQITTTDFRANGQITGSYANYVNDISTKAAAQVGATLTDANGNTFDISDIVITDTTQVGDTAFSGTFTASAPALPAVDATSQGLQFGQVTLSLPDAP